MDTKQKLGLIGLLLLVVGIASTVVLSAFRDCTSPTFDAMQVPSRITGEAEFRAVPKEPTQVLPSPNPNYK